MVPESWWPGETAEDLEEKSKSEKSYVIKGSSNYLVKAVLQRTVEWNNRVPTPLLCGTLTSWEDISEKWVLHLSERGRSEADTGQF